MKSEKRKISLTEYLLALLVMVLVTICLLIACGKMDANERASLEEQKVENQVGTLN